MPQFKSNSSLHVFQELIKEIYGVPDDRLFSLSDLISNLERFTMRSLKGIRKQDKKKLELTHQLNHPLCQSSLCKYRLE